jgi:hypothetical protein
MRPASAVDVFRAGSLFGRIGKRALKMESDLKSCLPDSPDTLKRIEIEVRAMSQVLSEIAASIGVSDRKKPGAKAKGSRVLAPQKSTGYGDRRRERQVKGNRVTCPLCKRSWLWNPGFFRRPTERGVCTCPECWKKPPETHGHCGPSRSKDGRHRSS